MFAVVPRFSNSALVYPPRLVLMELLLLPIGDASGACSQAVAMETAGVCSAGTEPVPAVAPWETNHELKSLDESGIEELDN